MTGAIPEIPGAVADLMRPPPGCRFHPRCPNALGVCREEQPPLKRMDPGQRAACHNPMPVREAEEVAASGA
jgi:oligopeptide/dipeptide ABC transporter ATP-binding protein